MYVLESGQIQIAATAAALTALVLWLLQPVAARFKLIDLPNCRKNHVHPTPNTGGLAMAIAVLVTGLATLPGPGMAFRAFALSSALLIVVGLLDDKYDLRWYWRVLAQVVAALLMVYLGGVRIEQLGPVFGLGELSLGALSVPFTVFATVGLINAVNMVDGADGFAGLLVTAAMVMLLAGALYSGNGAVSQMTLILLGSVGAFLTYNMRFPWQRRARVFMGNAGSAFLGFSMAWLAFSLTQNPRHPVSPILALWLVPIPVMDTLVLMIRRLRNGQSPFLADHNHIHHLMQEAGFGPTQAGLTLTLFSMLCGLLAGQALRLDIPHPLLLGAFLAMCLTWYWLTARRERAIGLFRKVHATRIVDRGWASGATQPEGQATGAAILLRPAMPPIAVALQPSIMVADKAGRGLQIDPPSPRALPADPTGDPIIPAWHGHAVVRMGRDRVTDRTRQAS